MPLLPGHGTAGTALGRGGGGGGGTGGLQSACLLHESSSIAMSKKRHFNAQYKLIGIYLSDNLKKIFYNFF